MLCAGGVLSPGGMYLVPGGVLSPRGGVLSPGGLYLVPGVSGLGGCLLWGVCSGGVSAWGGLLQGGLGGVWSGGVSTPRGVCFGGGCLLEGVCSRRCLLQGVSARGEGAPGQVLPPPREQNS